MKRALENIQKDGSDPNKTSLSSEEEQKARDEYQLSIIPKYYAELENGARALKHAFENGRDTQSEQSLHRLELLARQNNTATTRFEKLISRLYQYSSDLGTSIPRPLICTLITIFLMGLVYTFCWSVLAGGEWRWQAILQRQAISVEPWTWQAFWNGQALSAQAVFRPFSYWSFGAIETHPSDAAHFSQTLLFSNNAFCNLLIRFIMTVQSFFSIIMVFLTALSARRYFQLH